MQTKKNTSTTTVSLPKISHLQIAVLKSLGSGELSGKDLRTRLGECGIRKSGPAFYQLMARLEEVRLVNGWYKQRIVNGQVIKERFYRIRGKGVRALDEAQAFYGNMMPAREMGEMGLPMLA